MSFSMAFPRAPKDALWLQSESLYDTLNKAISCIFMNGFGCCFSDPWQLYRSVMHIVITYVVILT